MSADDFSDATAVSAEGARVGIVTCLRCGAAILLDPRDGAPRSPAAEPLNPLALHDEWHEDHGV